VELKREGFGNVDHHSPTSKEDLEKIQPFYNQSSPDPRSLIQGAAFNIMFHLIRHGRENLPLLTKESFAVKVDAAAKSLFIKLLMNWTKTTGQTVINQLVLQGKGVCIKDPRVPTPQLELFKMRASGHKYEISIRCYSRRPSEVKEKEIFHALSSDCSVKNLESTSSKIAALHEKTRENSLGRNTVPNSSVTMQHFASYSEETVNFYAGTYSGANLTINFYNSK